jgi:hypothetical protein
MAHAAAPEQQKKYNAQEFMPGQQAWDVKEKTGKHNEYGTQADNETVAEGKSGKETGSCTGK